MEAGRHFSRLRHPGEIALGPRAAETNNLRRFPVEISHFRGKRLIASVESAWQSCTEHTEVFLRRVNLRAGVDLQKVVQPTGMVALALGDDCEVQLCQVNALGLDIMREDLCIIAGIE